jgi:hypothetical protein
MVDDMVFKVCNYQRCLSFAHKTKDCVNETRCSACFNYGHIKRNCLNGRANSDKSLDSKKGKIVSTSPNSATVSVGLTYRVAVSPPKVQDSSKYTLPHSDWEQTSHQPPMRPPLSFCLHPWKTSKWIPRHGCLGEPGDRWRADQAAAHVLLRHPRPSSRAPGSASSTQLRLRMCRRFGDIRFGISWLDL